MIKLLFLVAYPNINGPLPKILPILLGQLENFGCEIQQDFWSRHSDHESFLDKIFGRFQDIQRIRKQLQKSSFDLMVITTTHDWMAVLRDLPLLIIVRSLCPKIVIHFHGSSSNLLVEPGNFLFKVLTKWILWQCDGVILLSSEELKQMEIFNPSGKYYVTCNPVIQYEDYLSDKSPQQTSHKDKELLFVGRLIEAKGVLDLVEAMRLVLQQAPCHLTIAGDGPLSDKLKSRIHQLDLGSKVTIAGYLEGKVLTDAYRKSDIFALPTYFGEGFPTVITEAMSNGLPIVTTRLRGPADHLIEGENVLFVPPKDPHALAAAIVKLIKDPGLCEQMGKNNQEKVKVFSPEIVGKQYIGILEKILKRV